MPTIYKEEVPTWLSETLPASEPRDIEETIHDWLCLDTCICQPQVIKPSAKEQERWNLTRVVHIQSEDCAPGWHQIFCVDCDAIQTAMGPVDGFVALIQKLGWAVDSADRATAICHACANAESEEPWARQYQDNAGGILD